MRARRALQADAHIRLFAYMTSAEQVRALCAYHALYLRLTDPGLVGTLLLGALELVLNAIKVPSTIVDFVIERLDDLRRQDLLDCTDTLR